MVLFARLHRQSWIEIRRVGHAVQIGKAIDPCAAAIGAYAALFAQHHRIAATVLHNHTRIADRCAAVGDDRIDGIEGRARQERATGQRPLHENHLIGHTRIEDTVHRDPISTGGQRDGVEDAAREQHGQRAGQETRTRHAVSHCTRW